MKATSLIIGIVALAGVTAFVVAYRSTGETGTQDLVDRLHIEAESLDSAPELTGVRRPAPIAESNDQAVDAIARPSADESDLDPSLIGIIGRQQAEYFAILHAGTSDADLKSALLQIYKRVPAQAVSAPHVAAYQRGEFELLQEVPETDEKWIDFAPKKGEMERNIPFVSVFSTQADGAVVRTNVAPTEFAGYSHDVSEAVWIHFERRRRKALKRARK